MKLIRSLQVLEGPDQGRVWPLTRRETVLGRDDSAHQKLSDHEVSRQHCKLVVKGNKIEVHDLGSTNGTRVNGERVERAALATGDLLRIGRTEMRLVTQEVSEEGEAGDLTQIKAKVAVVGEVAGRVRGVGFAGRVMAVVMLLTLLGWLVTSGPLISGQGKALTEEAKRRGAVLALALAAANREGLRLGEEMLVDVKSVAKEDGVLEAMVLDRGGRILAPVARLHQVMNDERSRRALAADGLLMQEISPGEYDIAMPIRAFNPSGGSFVKVGTARIIFSLAHAKTMADDSWVTALISLLVLLALAGVSAWVVVRLANQPLMRLKEDCETALKERQTDLPLPKGFTGAAEVAEQMTRLLGKLAQAAAAEPSPSPTPVSSPAPPARGEGALRALADLVSDGVLLLDGGHQVRLANPAWGRLLGARPASLEGRHLLEAVEDKQLLAGLLALIEQGKAQPGRPVQTQVALADGRRVALAAQVETTPGGEPGLVLVALAGTPAN